MSQIWIAHDRKIDCANKAYLLRERNCKQIKVIANSDRGCPAQRCSAQSRRARKEVRSSDWLTSLINVLGLIDDVQLLTARHFSQRKSLVVNNAATNIAYHEVAFPDYDTPGDNRPIFLFTAAEANTWGTSAKMLYLRLNPIHLLIRFITKPFLFGMAYSWSHYVQDDARHVSREHREENSSK